MVEPTIECAQALNGRIFATLSPDELEVWRFYRDRGRKFGVAVSVIGDVDPVALANANPSQAEEILRRSNGRVTVEVRKD